MARAGGGRKKAQPQAQQQQIGDSGPSLPKAQRFAFLQVMMERSWMPEAESSQLFAELSNLAGGGYSLRETVAEINDALGFLLMELRPLKYPIDNSRYLGYINKDNDQVAKEHGSWYSAPQKQYLRGVIEAIAQDHAAEAGVGMISGVDAMNINCSQQFLTQATQAFQGSQAVAASKALNMSEKEKALDLFVEEGWLARATTHRGYFCLGVRTFMELHQMLLQLELPEGTRQAWESFL